MKPYPKTSNFFWNKVSFISYSPFCSSSAIVHIIIREYISKIADSTISVGVSKNLYSKAKCVCNASIIFMEPPSNLRNIHDSNASLDITITFPFYLKYPQNLPEFLFMNRKVYRYSLLFLISTHVRFTKTNIRSHNWEDKGFKSRQTD